MINRPILSAPHLTVIPAKTSNVDLTRRNICGLVIHMRVECEAQTLQCLGGAFAPKVQLHPSCSNLCWIHNI